MNKIAILSQSAAWHAQYNVLPNFKEEMDFIPWHRFYKLKDYDILYLIGWYVYDIRTMQDHYGLLSLGKPVVIHWAGTDILSINEYSKSTNKEKLLTPLLADNVVHFAETEQMKREVEEFGVRNIGICPVSSRKQYTPLPLPLKFDGTVEPVVSVYLPVGRTAFFNYELIMKVAEKLPDVNFILYSNSSAVGCRKLTDNVVDWGKIGGGEQMDDLIGVTSMHLRIVEHDGRSLSVIENMMAGRRVIYNQDSPFVERVQTDVDSIVGAINRVKGIAEPHKEASEFYTKEYGAETHRRILLGKLKEKGWF